MHCKSIPLSVLYLREPGSALQVNPFECSERNHFQLTDLELAVINSTERSATERSALQRAMSGELRIRHLLLLDKPACLYDTCLRQSD